ncbi:MAG: AsnC family transcriptional regulator, partial [Shewanella sp.]|nr:AsnC family transcriptional regulator [Shewanella sp.]
METSFQRDQLDNQILSALMKEARTPFAELAKRFNVSAGT